MFSQATNIGYVLAFLLVGSGGMLALTFGVQPNLETKIYFWMFFVFTIVLAGWFAYIIATGSVYEISGPDALLVMYFFGICGVGLWILGLLGLFFTRSIDTHDPELEE